MASMIPLLTLRIGHSTGLLTVLLETQPVKANSVMSAIRFFMAMPLRCVSTGLFSQQSFPLLIGQCRFQYKIPDL